MHIEPLIEAAHAGGKIVREYFGQVLDLTVKSHASDFKTKADEESEQVIIEILKKSFPDFNIYAEESGKVDNNSEYTFVIDPLDGTNNFVIGVPNFCVSIGLMKGSEIIAGVIYSPIINQTFSAQKGEGAFCDGKKLAVNSEQRKDQSTVCICGSYGSYYTPQFGRTMINLMDQHYKRVINSWCSPYDMCLIASGKIESLICLKGELYDFCAAKIIARESGAIITDLAGNIDVSDDNPSFIISNSLSSIQDLSNSIQKSQN